MERIKMHIAGTGMLWAALAISISISLACATPAPTPTQVSRATPIATATSVLTTRTPVQPTPTGALATPTSVVASKPQYGGELRYAGRVTPDTLDPHHSSNSSDTFPVFFVVYNQIANIDGQGKLLPELAKSWSFSADGKSVTFNLQEGVTFHDGTRFNAEVVKWNFDRVANPEENSNLKGDFTQYVQSVEVVNENTFVMHLYRPFRPLLALLGSERMGMIPSPAAVKKYGGGVGGVFGRNPVGTGPFRFVEWVPASHVLVQRSTSYWIRGQPYLDSIRYQSVSDPSVRLAMLRVGETDLVWNNEVRTEDLPKIELNPQLKIVKYEGNQFIALHFNVGKPPFNNKALRQAIAYATDREAFIGAALGGAGKPGYTLLTVGWASNPEIKPYTFALAKAKEKLAEAGYSSGATIPLDCPSSGFYPLWCELFQAIMAKASIKVDVKMLLNVNYWSAGDKGYLKNSGLGIAVWAARMDPHILPQFLLHSKGGRNLGTYENPEVDRLIDEAATTYDTAKAKLLYDKIQTIATQDDVVMAVVAWADKFVPLHKRVQDFTAYPDKFERLASVWIAK